MVCTVKERKDKNMTDATEHRAATPSCPYGVCGLRTQLGVCLCKFKVQPPNPRWFAGLPDSHQPKGGRDV
jgi:hypothetical protein